MVREKTSNSLKATYFFLEFLLIVFLLNRQIVFAQPSPQPQQLLLWKMDTWMMTYAAHREDVRVGGGANFVPGMDGMGVSFLREGSYAAIEPADHLAPSAGYIAFSFMPIGVDWENGTIVAYFLKHTEFPFYFRYEGQVLTFLFYDLMGVTSDVYFVPGQWHDMKIVWNSVQKKINIIVNEELLAVNVLKHLDALPLSSHEKTILFVGNQAEDIPFQVHGVMDEFTIVQLPDTDSLEDHLPEESDFSTMFMDEGFESGFEDSSSNRGGRGGGSGSFGSTSSGTGGAGTNNITSGPPGASSGTGTSSSSGGGGAGSSSSTGSGSGSGQGGPGGTGASSTGSGTGSSSSSSSSSGSGSTTGTGSTGTGSGSTGSGTTGGSTGTTTGSGSGASSTSSSSTSGSTGSSTGTSSGSTGTTSSTGSAAGTGSGSGTSSGTSSSSTSSGSSASSATGSSTGTGSSGTGSSGTGTGTTSGSSGASASSGSGTGAPPPPPPPSW